MSSMAVSLDIAHILILHGATRWNFPPSSTALDTSSCQLNTFRLQLELPCPHLDPEISEQTLGNHSGFSLKRERDQTACCTRVFFLHREHHISCNISSSHGALMTRLPEQQEILTPSQHSLPARLPAPAMPCFSLSKKCSSSFYFTLLPATSLYQDTNTSKSD